MPTTNNGAKARAVMHLADAGGALRELKTGLLTVAGRLPADSEQAIELRRRAKYTEALCTQVKSIQAELHEQLGHGRLPEHTEIEA